VGAQIGAACTDAIRRAVAFEPELPSRRSRSEQLALAERYREVTAAAYPWFIQELEGAAEAAGVDPLAVFACTIEEIWYEPRTHALAGRCSDLVAVPPATEGGRVIVGHNNDLSRSYQESLVAIEWRVDGDPTVLSIGNGIWLSAGWNSAGISFTGNELAPNDERVGIPREVQFRSMLRQPTIDTAVGEALRHDRASSYNQVLVDRSGRAVNVEGSATDAELTEPDERGHLVHTNHYVCHSMLRYEGDPEHAGHSAVRYRRAAELLAAEPDGTITVERMRKILADHEHAPDSLCRHPERFGGDTATVFWCVADLTDMRVAFGRGNPCDSTAQTYAFGEG
jgi:isopenicillin-N N-acyltransferase-like protein